MHPNLQKAIKQYASVADQLLFDSLPEDVKAAIIRLYEAPPAEGPGGYTEDDMREAFEAGWEECLERVDRPYASDFADWLKYR